MLNTIQTYQFKKVTKEIVQLIIFKCSYFRSTESCYHFTTSGFRGVGRAASG